jgi:putative ABC transport system permease protein
MAGHTAREYSTRPPDGRGGFAGFGQDIRFAARVLRRQPVFTIAAVLSLALGIAATAAVCSIVDTVFLRPLPYAHAERLVWVAAHFAGTGGPRSYLLSPDYVVWRRDNRVFEQLAATTVAGPASMVLGGPEPTEIHAGRVSANFLDTFAITPALGRNFEAAEELSNGPKAVVLTDQFWRQHFHARADAVGSAVMLDGQPYTVVGVLPKSFIFPVDAKIDLLTPFAISPTERYRFFTCAVFGRLKPGVTLAQARANLETLFAVAKANFPLIYSTATGLVIQPLAEHRAGDVRTLLLVLLGATGCLLAIACANVANLLMARWSGRSRELAVRAAIGAGRGRLARQLFTEIALLVAAGAVAALVLVTAALRVFVHFAAAEFPRLSEVTIDGRVFAIALAVSVLTTAIFGGLPLLWSVRTDLQSVLQQAGRGGSARGHRFLRRALVVTELALSVVLVSGGALLFETLWHIWNDSLGFQPEHVLSVSIPLRGPSASITDAARQALASGILDDLRRIPGTQAAVLTECTPLSFPVIAIFARSDRPRPDPYFRDNNTIGLCDVGPDYLKAAGTRLVAGRFLTEGDFLHPGTLAVINEAAARAYFPGESPLGKQILGSGSNWRTVVGVIADTKNQGLTRSAMPQAFLNDTSSRPFVKDLLFLVRTLAPPAAVAHAIWDRNLFSKVETLDDAMGQMTATPRFNTVLLATFAGIALLMAIVGVYGVLAFTVTQRGQEIGIRMALGASPQAVLALVMREGVLLAGAGAVAGVAGALFLTRYLKAMLYGVTATDPRTYAGVVVGLALAAAAASFLPARRAAALDPMKTLRHE